MFRWFSHLRRSIPLTDIDSKEEAAVAVMAAASPPTPTTSSSPQVRQLSCTKCFVALWFCYRTFSFLPSLFRMPFMAEYIVCFSWVLESWYLIGLI